MPTPTVNYITANDNRPEITETFKDASGTVVDITSWTITCQIRDPSTKLLTLGGSASVVSGAAGTMKYTPVVGDFPEAGIHTISWQGDDGSGNLRTYPPYGGATPTLIVAPDQGDTTP